MYNKILVPVDGSGLAECVLPHVESIAKGCGVKEVIFLRAVEPVSAPYGAISDGHLILTESDTAQIRAEIDSKNKEAAEQYLNQVVSQQKYAGVKVQSAVVMGKAADSIADYATQNDIDLIIIASHGRTGVSRWVLGSVADRIAHSTCAPVLIVRAPGCVVGI